MTSALVRVVGLKTPGQSAWLAMSVEREEDARQVRIDIDPMAAVLRDTTSFLFPLTESEAKIIKSEIVGGILMARKQLKGPGMTVRLLYLGGTNGDNARVAEIGSVAYAVAAHVLVVHGLGNEAERADLRGGFGWRVESVESL
jgi:hypothetical protein